MGRYASCWRAMRLCVHDAYLILPVPGFLSHTAVGGQQQSGFYDVTMMRKRANKAKNDTLKYGTLAALAATVQLCWWLLVW